MPPCSPGTGEAGGIFPEVNEMVMSRRVRREIREGSWIRRVFEEGLALKRELGEEAVFDLSLGNPVLEPPEAFRQELKRLVASPLPGMHRYMPNPGYPDSRAAVARQLSTETGLPFTHEHIVMTVGAAGGLNVVLKVLLNRGDEVAVFVPYFWEYRFYISNHGGKLREYPTDERFYPDLEVLEARLSPRTRAVIINSPNNPTGAMYPKELLRGLGQVLQEKEAQFGHPIFLLSDDPYRKLVFDGLECPSVFHYHPHTMMVTSHSKDLAIPGERIGYIAAHPGCDGLEELANALGHCNRTLGFVNAPALMQHVVAALQGLSVDPMEYQRRRDFLYGHLVEMGYSVVKPQGAFYMFPKTPVKDDVAFCTELARHRVLTVPGRGFGSPGYFRIAYCVEEHTLEGSLEGFRAAASRFGLG
jgi:aspartate aminotransferase